MSTRTSTLLIAAALTAAAFNVSAQAEDADTVARGAAETSPAAKPQRTLGPRWWQEERARDDGYAWPSAESNSAPRRRRVAKDEASDERTADTGR